MARQVGYALFTSQIGVTLIRYRSVQHITRRYQPYKSAAVRAIIAYGRLSPCEYLALNLNSSCG